MIVLLESIGVYKVGNFEGCLVVVNSEKHSLSTKEISTIKQQSLDNLAIHCLRM